MLYEQKALEATLSRYGFSVSETSLYLEMLRKQEISAGELHRITGQSRPRTYEVINQMVLKGYCQVRIEGQRKFYSALEPSQIRNMMIRKWEEEKEGEDELFLRLDEMYQRGRSNAQPLDFIQVIRTKDMINHTFVNLVNDAKESIYGFVCRPYSGHTKERFDAQHTALNKADKRGVRSLSIYSAEDISSELLRKASAGAETRKYADVRIRADLPAKVFIFDEKTVLLAIPSIPGEKISDFSMMVLHDESNAKVYTQLFHIIWNESMPYEEWKQQFNAIQQIAV